MKHVVNTQSPPTKLANGQVVWPHLTMCGLQLGFASKLARGTVINAGTRSDDVCPECSAACETLSFMQGDNMAVHAGNSQDQHNISSAVYDQSHGADMGRPITKVSGIGDSLIKSEMGKENNGDFLGNYLPESDEIGNPLGGLEADPYGEGDAAYEKGANAARAGTNLHTTPPPYPPGSFMFKRFMEGYSAGRMMSSQS